MTASGFFFDQCIASLVSLTARAVLGDVSHSWFQIFHNSKQTFTKCKYRQIFSVYTKILHWKLFKKNKAIMLRNNTKRKLLDELNVSESGKNKKVKSNPQSETIDNEQNKSGKNANISISRKNPKLIKEFEINKIKTGKIKGKNNNTVPENPKNQNSGKFISVKGRSSQTGKGKISPIIRTWGMKAREIFKSKLDRIPQQDFEDELCKLNEIDRLTSEEISGGDNDASDICNYGVELSCEGSDLDEFPDTADNTEPGELSNEEPEPGTSTQGSVRSKVVKVNKTTTNTRSDKYAHLRHDPEFHQFLDEMLDVRMNRKQDFDSGDAEHHRHQRRNMSTSGKQQPLMNGRSGEFVENKTTPQQLGGNVNTQNQRNFKSLLDTTIYSPGLMCANKEESIIDKISNFVEGIRIDSRKGRLHDKVRSDQRWDDHDQDSFTPQRRIVRSRSRSHSPGYRHKDKEITATAPTSA